ncbi:hypothetical protein KO528_15690 [Saccharophagus degradans]|uniref:hypothetical protein n=1 Tax=Saccharophagus degradans TaxID=86304 RepID=UPI001C08FB9B|nr:hypothetical protein [Saccharophagus degradans]MBU2986807.1 hypothetical protein [Saccharophagus degradans]
MLIHNCYSYVQIGLAIRLLRNVTKISTKKFVLSSIETLTECLEEGNFEVTITAMRSHTYSQMVTDLRCLNDDVDEIGVDLAKRVVKEFKIIETVVFPESCIKKIYILPNRRFNSEYLLNDPGKLLADGVYEKLDEIARHDISSACRCLLFGEATAAAFHILRATEAVLKSYYFHHRRTKRLSKPMWANMLDQLRAKTRNKPPAILLNSLDLIRSAYRNPTQHPEATYEIDSVQDLFGVCLDSIGKMGREI